MKDYFNEPVFVLGLPRSGTSMIAGSLSLCGAWTGSTIPGVAGENPHGFFEHGTIREGIVKQLLRQMGSDPAGVTKLPAVNLGVSVPGLADVFRHAITADGYANDRPWLYKDAKLTLLWPVIANAFPQATWVIVTRDRQSIIDSCLNTSFMRQHSNDISFWEKFIDEYQHRIGMLQHSGRRVLEIRAEDPISGNFEPLQELAGQLCLTFDRDKVTAFVSPADWHGKTTPHD